VYSDLLIITIYIKILFLLDRNAKVNPAIGDIVKVFSHLFSDFYRAKILDIDNNQFHVSYIDFGNTEIVSSNEIFELSDELKIKVYQKVMIYMYLNLIKIILP